MVQLNEKQERPLRGQDAKGRREGMKRKGWIVLAAAVLAAVLWCAAAAADSSGSLSSDISWTLEDIDGLLTISGDGPMPDFSSSAPSPFKGNTNIRKAVIGPGVTSIGSHLFEDCSKLTTVDISRDAETIGEEAFYNSGLMHLTIPSSVTSIGNRAFSDCDSLKSLVIPGNVKTIGAYAFSNCDQLEYVAVEYGVGSIGEGAFLGCASLTEADIPDDDVSFGNISFRGCNSSLVINGWAGSTAAVYAEEEGIDFSSYTVSGQYGALSWTLNPHDGELIISGSGPMPAGETADYPWHASHKAVKSVVINKGITTIAANAFYGYSYMTTARIRSTVTSIGDYAFGECESLYSVIMYNGLKTIGEGAFAFCDSLCTVHLPNSVTSLGLGAFYNASLNYVILPSSVAVIGDNAFDNMVLIDATVYNSNAVFGEDVFESVGVLYGWAGSTAQTYASDHGIPFEALDAPEPAFFLPSGLTEIAADAFSGIMARAVVIPKSVKKINGNPFAESSVICIYGYSGSVAQTFAASYGYGFVEIDDDWMAGH